MKTTIKTLSFAAILITAFACKNSNSTGQVQDDSESAKMQTNDVSGSPADDSQMQGDSTTTGTTAGDNGAQSSAGSASQNGAGTYTGQTGSTPTTP